MVGRIWGGFLLAGGLFTGLYHLTTDPVLLTAVSFSLAVAGLLLLLNPYSLRWCAALFLAPSAAFGVLGFLHSDQVFASLTWIGVAVLPLWEVFGEAKQRRFNRNA